MDSPTSEFGIAVAHSIFNLICTILLLPMSNILEKLVTKLVPDTDTPESVSKLDERLLGTPTIALERCEAVAIEMAQVAIEALRGGLSLLSGEYDPELANEVRENEEKTDHYEDILGTYLVKLSGLRISEADSAEAAKLLKIIGDFERISDHGVDLLKSKEELIAKNIVFTKAAQDEISVMASAINEILDLSYTAFAENDLKAAYNVEPLEQVIDGLKEHMRTHHILRMQQGECLIDAGFIWADLLTSLERTSDHCSNIAGCIIDMAHNNMNIHESLREFRDDSSDFKEKYNSYQQKYALS